MIRCWHKLSVWSEMQIEVLLKATATRSFAILCFIKILNGLPF